MRDDHAAIYYRFIFPVLGMRIGGIGVGFAGGAGVIALCALGATPGDLPMLVIVLLWLSSLQLLQCKKRVGLTIWLV